MKRVRYSSAEEDGTDDEVEMAEAMAVGNNSSSDGVITSRSSEFVTDALVKFLVSIDASVNVSKNSHFRTLLTRVAQHGVPSCLFQNDSIRIQKSVWNLEHEVNQYIKMVKESWKTTGCTMMLYRLPERQGNLSSFHRDNLVFGFYCPKEFFFVDGRTLAHSDDIRGALNNHVLNLPTDDIVIVQVIYHSSDRDDDGDYQPCELAYEAPHYNWHSDLSEEPGVLTMPCLQQSIYQLCRKICKTSEWVQEHIEKSERIHEYILDKSMHLDWEQGKVKMAVDGQACSYSRLRSIMGLEYELKTWIVHLPPDKRSSLDCETGIPTIINSSEFWQDGKQIIAALDPLFEIPNSVDTLVPTAGYMQLLIDGAKSDRKKIAKQETVSQCFDKLWKAYYSAPLNVAAYFSPIYFLCQQVEDFGLINTLNYHLKSIVGKEEQEALNAELEAYDVRSSNPFASLDDDECWLNHPVKLWEKYGGEFPVLQKCAIKVLSQPVSCLCKQVKKHISRIQGTDNFILRLNFRMMEEFHKLGDGIYKILEV